MTSFAGSREPAWNGGGRRELQEWRGNTTLGRQDKRGSPVVSQAIDMAWFPACLSVGARAALEDFVKDFNVVSGTVRLTHLLAGLR
ncbi:hypothetical protein NKJ52_10300 [Mesorhizobium australicum]|uniref:hypothetical protein n=1 Tax=Mesorhizobium australicum TaxID=536018 RepID=UPI003339B5F5